MQRLQYMLSTLVHSIRLMLNTLHSKRLLSTWTFLNDNQIIQVESRSM